jgi:ubiquinone/menaquinone biosynthesis C-methylase UbiE
VNSQYEQANVDRFMGFAAQYDAHRPQPPLVVVDVLCQLIRRERPQLVVDLGSGTGLSTTIWADRADQVIGIEPSEDMRREAENRATGIVNVKFQAGLSTATGLPDDCADIITCSQSLHWMEPMGTFAEVARLLHPAGVFAAIDCDWPPTLDWEAELAYNECMSRVRTLEKEHNIAPAVKAWDKTQHLTRLAQNGYFRYVKEITIHNVERGNADRLVGIALSQGSTAALLKHGLSEAEIGISDLRDAAQRLIGSELRPWYFSYRVRLAIK